MRDASSDRRVESFRLAEPLDTRRLPFDVWTAVARFRAEQRPGGPAESVRPLASFLPGEEPVPFADLGPWILALASLFAPGRGRWRWLPLGVVIAQAWLVGQVFLAPLALLQ